MTMASADLRIAWESHQDRGAYKLETLVRQQSGVYDVRRNDIEQTLTVTYDEQRTRLEDIVEWVARYGHILRLPGYEDY